jgi:hypothetical protein
MHRAALPKIRKSFFVWKLSRISNEAYKEITARRILLLKKIPVLRFRKDDSQFDFEKALRGRAK